MLPQLTYATSGAAPPTVFAGSLQVGILGKPGNPGDRSTGTFRVIGGGPQISIGRNLTRGVDDAALAAVIDDTGLPTAQVSGVGSAVVVASSQSGDRAMAQDREDDRPRFTVGVFKELLKGWPDDYVLTFSGVLDFYRLKSRGPKLVEVEFNQTVYRDSSGCVDFQVFLRF
jgi:hypothetical protein